MEQVPNTKVNVKKILKITFSILSVIIIMLILLLIIAYNTMTTSMQVFLNNDLSTEQEESIRKQIEIICNTTDIEYVSKDNALQQMKQNLDNANILNENNINSNIFPTSYIVNDVKFSKLSTLEQEILKVNGVKKVTSTNFYMSLMRFLFDISAKDSDSKNLDNITYEGLTKEEVKNIVTNNVNTGKIYVDDVQKIFDIKYVSLKETVSNIELWEMYIEYEKSSLNAPIGQNYKGKTFSGTYYYAYNKETKKSFIYMFKIDEYDKLKGWSTQGHKEDNSYWVD